MKGFAALVGAPNSGKTTLYNWLTGARFKTVNYPGSTVEYSIGETQARWGSPLQVMDTPGTYSLAAKSPDEQVTSDAIFEHPKYGQAAVVISVVDATHLSRHLLMTRQLQECGFRVVVALTMVDVVRDRGDEIDVPALAQELGVPVIAIDGRLGGGVDGLLALVREQYEYVQVAPHQANLKTWTPQQVEAAQKKGVEVSRRVLKAKHVQPIRDSALISRRLDRWLLHPVAGIVLFTLIMGVLFTAIFWAAQPMMDAVDHAFSWAADQVYALAPGALWSNFLARGVIASFGAVMVFVPQIFILFLGIVFLEDSGYLARAATLMDRPLSKFGLNGRSFVPILSAYACAVPAMIAARAIGSRRERWLTLFMIPLMTCSARLPVYALLLSFVFRGQPAWLAGLALTGLYIASLLVGGIAALVADRFLKIRDHSFFLLELPLYRRPRTRVVVRQALTRTMGYVRRAGPTIAVFALILWVATTFPNYQSEDKGERLQSSYAGRTGRVVEPVFTPMGLDWRVGVGLISAFAAREVFVSSLAVVFHVADEDEASMQAGLLKEMAEAKMPDGQQVFTTASVTGLILFFMIALQCLSTVGVAVRESGGYRFALMQLVVFNVAAYVLAVLVVQGLRSIGVA